MENKQNTNSRRKIFAELVFRKYINGSNIETACERLLQQLNSDSNPEHEKSNSERKRILENCLTLFRNPETATEIEQIRKTENLENGPKLIKRVIAEFYEEIFDADKREYDMSTKYNPNVIPMAPDQSGVSRKLIEFRDLSDIPVTIVPDGHGNELTFDTVGRLAYQTRLAGKSFINKYSIYKNSEELLCEVFARINLSMLSSDEAYRRAVIKELLSNKNLNHASTNSHYIGEIQPTSPDEKVQIGEQAEFCESYQTLIKYGYSDLYDWVFDCNAFSAARDFEKYHPISKETNKKPGTDR